MTERGRVPVAGLYTGPASGPWHQTAAFRTGLLIAGIHVLLVAVSCSSEELQEAPARAVESPTVVASPTPVPPTATAAALTPSPVSTATATATPEPTPSPAVGVATLKKMQVEPAFPGLEFDRMVDLTYADDGTDRLFLVLQPGRIMVFHNNRDVASAKTFLDISARVNDRGSEEGLLGLAFDPQYRTNGYFYVYYSASPPRRSVISRFAVSDDDPDRADPGSERVVLEVPQPFANHNGGKVIFGPDGYLYVGLGDGGSGGDPRGNGQNRSTLLGTILRIDVSPVASEAAYVVPPGNPFAGGGEGKEEIWAYGLRNPWRFTFDRETGDLWVADVGQNRYEEIDVIKPGLNYGWNRMEGFHCFFPRDCDTEGLEPPIIEYGRDGGCSVTGGYVYRGSRLPSLSGAYVYGDFCSGKIWALRYDGERVTEHLELVDSSLQVSAFGEDPAGELYILSYDGGIYRLSPE